MSVLSLAPEGQDRAPAVKIFCLQIACEGKVVFPAEYDKILDMNRCAAVKDGDIRRVARRSYADAARLGSMVATQDRASATRSSTVATRSQHGDKVRVAAQREIRLIDKDKTMKKKREKRSEEDQARLDRLLKSPSTRVGTIPGEGRNGIDTNSPFYDLWKEQNGNA